MDWLLKGVIVWVSIDVLLIASIWYLSQTIMQLWPDWWREVVVDTLEPDFTDDLLVFPDEVKRADVYAVDLN